MWWWFHQPAVSANRPSVALLNFENQSGRPGAAWLSTALSEMLSSELATGGDLRVIPGATVARMRRELSLDATGTLSEDTLERIGKNLNTDYAVSGTYLTFESNSRRQLRLLLVLQDTRKGILLASLDRTGLETEPFDLVSDVGAELREELGVGRISIVEERAVRATLPSRSEAFRLYLEGLDELRSFDAQTARDLLEKAIDIEPDYALAHAALSEAWSALGYDQEAADNARRADGLAAGLPREESLRIKGRYYVTAADWQRAIETHRTLWRSFPDSVDYGLSLAEAQVTAGRGRSALATVEALRALPGDDPRIDLAEASARYSLSDYKQQLAASERAAEKARALGASILVAEARRWQGEALRWLFRVDEAAVAFAETRRLFAEAGDQGKVAQALKNSAHLLLYNGDLSGAEQLYQESMSIHRETGNRKEVAETQNSLAVVLYCRGDLATARSMLEEAVAIAREFGDRRREADYLDTLIDVLLRQGDLAAARVLAQEELAIYQETGNQDWSGWSYFNLGRVALASGDVPRALELHNEALIISDKAADSYLTGFVVNALAKDLLAQGDLPGAMRMSVDSRAIRRRLGGDRTLATSQMTAAQILLENGRASEAEALSREAAGVFRANAWSDDETAATVLLARTLLAQDEPAEAEATLAGIRERAGASQNPTVRMSAAMAEAELHATAGRADDAMGILESVAEETHRLGLTQLELEARLAWGEIEVTSGRRSAARVDSGRRRLEGLAEKARELGCGLIARKAADTLAGSRNRAAAALPGIRDTEVW